MNYRNPFTSKRYFVAYAIILFTSNTFSQSMENARGYIGRDNGPLPPWSEVGLFLLGALGLYLLSRLLSSASTAIEKKETDSPLATSIGCFGTLAFFAAIGCLIPLFMWVERIGLAILLLVGVGIVVMYLVEVLKNWLK